MRKVSEGIKVAAGFIALVCAGWASTNNLLSVSEAEAAPRVVDTRLNSTGRSFVSTFPLLVEGRGNVGEVAATISSDDKVSVDKASFISLLKKGDLTSEAIATIESLGQGRFISLTELTQSGFDTRFDSNELTLRFSPKGNQSQTRKLSLGTGEAVISENLQTPERFSGYLNIRTGLDYLNTSSGSELQSPYLGLESAIRFLNVVFENEFSVEAGDGKSLSDTGWSDYSSRRLGSRFVYDRPENALRFKLGDINPIGSGYQQKPDLLGVIVEKSYRKLQPNRSIRPTGRTSFQLDRPSKVEVVVNGNVRKAMDLQSGNYDLDDLSLGFGANDITLRITDNLGQKRELSFSAFSGASLLADGISEWAASAGIKSSTRDSDKKLEYDSSDVLVSGLYRVGINSRLTGEFGLQADKETVVGDVRGLIQSAYGFFSLSAALSNNDVLGVGGALNLSWSKQRSSAQRNSSYRVALDYLSDDFVTVGGSNDREHWLRLNAGVSRPLSLNLSSSLSGSYALASDGANKTDRYNFDLGLSRRISRKSSAGIGLGYGNQRYGSDLSDNGEVYASLFFNYTFDSKSNLRSSYSTRNEQLNLDYNRSSGVGVGSWNTQLGLDYETDSKNASVNGSFGYVANRGILDLSHTTALDGSSSDKTHTTSLRLGTSVAFAGRRIAVGRPISGGFAIVSPHSSIGNSTVSIGSPDNITAKSGWLGGALVSQAGAYTLSRLSADVDDIPLGYDLGDGVFDLFAPYKAGYALTLGSSYSVSGTGFLLDQGGEPLSLLTGVASEVGKQGAKVIPVFTNRKGRFAAQGLAPGRWVIEMNSTPMSRYVINVPAGADGLFDAGKLTPQN